MTSASRSRASWPELAVKLARMAAEIIGCRLVAQWPSMLRREVHAAALPRAAEPLADRGPEPVVAV